VKDDVVGDWVAGAWGHGLGRTTSSA
jgi:hypothetical protein